MTIPDERIECRVDIFQHVEQRARVKPATLPEEMLAAIVEEFHVDIPYLGRNLDRYHLQCDRALLQAGTPLGSQIQSGAKLTLVENELSKPIYAQQLDVPIYFKEIRSGHVFKVSWVPAIIGRLDPSHPYSEQVSVDLTRLENSVRVSRRHIELSERDGILYAQLKSLQNEATLLKKKQKERVKLNDRYVSLENGDILRLERSKIELEVMLLSKP